MPDPKTESAVINTGPVIALSLLGRFELLSRLYQNIYTPEAVVQEILFGGKGAPGYDEVTKDTLIDNGFWLKKQLYDWALAEARE